MVPEVQERTEERSESAPERRSAAAALSHAARIAAGLAAHGMADMAGRILGPPPDDPVTTRALRLLMEELRPAALARWKEPLALLGGAGARVTVQLQAHFPGGEVAPAAVGLRTIDRAWRLARLVAESSTRDVPRDPIADLSRLAPPETDGLSFATVEVGSLRSVFRDVTTTASRVAALAAMLNAFYTTGAHAVHIAHGLGGGAGHRQHQVLQAPGLPRSLVAAIQAELGTLPPGTTIDLHAVTPDGTDLRLHFGARTPRPR